MDILARVYGSRFDLRMVDKVSCTLEFSSEDILMLIGESS